MNPPPPTNNPTLSTTSTNKSTGGGIGKTTIFTPLFNGINYFNHHIMYMNNSKLS